MRARCDVPRSEISFYQDISTGRPILSASCPRAYGYGGFICQLPKVSVSVRSLRGSRKKRVCMESRSFTTRKIFAFPMRETLMHGLVLRSWLFFCDRIKQKRKSRFSVSKSGFFPYPLIVGRSARQNLGRLRKDRISMTQRCKIAVIGGDERQIYMARALARKGWDVSVWGLGECEARICPAMLVQTPEEALENARAFASTTCEPGRCAHQLPLGARPLLTYFQFAECVGGRLAFGRTPSSRDIFSCRAITHSHGGLLRR